MRRKTSVSVRTAVVLPVPPFCESTAIVTATRATIERCSGSGRGPPNMWNPGREVPERRSESALGARHRLCAELAGQAERRRPEVALEELGLGVCDQHFGHA